jgi:porin
LARFWSREAVFTAVLLVGMPAGGAVAQDAEEPPTGIPESSIARNFPNNGDADGRRAALAQRGITFGINYYGEGFANVDGGIRTGTRYSGMLETIVDVDLEKLKGWRGLTFHTSAFQLHGRGISANHVGLLNPVSNIEATPSTRLFELWLEQELIKDKLSLRFGQMRVDYDGEFINSQTAGLFLNTNFGWPAFTGLNLPSGGVTFPLAGMGARLKYTPNDKWTFLGAVFNDDPAGPCAGDPQACNNNGLKFRTQDKPFYIGEAQYKYSDGKAPGSLKGQLKFGLFVDFGKFDDQRIGTDGLSLADPASNGVAVPHRNRGIYGVVDQQLYRSTRPGAGDGDGVFAFGRIAGLPADRNIVDITIDGGLRFTGMIPARPADEFGFGFAYNRISSRLAGFDRDVNFFNGTALPVHSAEVVAEATYKAKLAEGWFLQPDVQYIWRPGGNAADPNVPAKRIDNAVVLGLRSTVNY